MTKLRTLGLFCLEEGRVRSKHWSTTLSGGKTACAAVLFCAAAATASAGQTLETLARFNGTDGSSPSAALVQATNGDFYGTTYYGGAADQGAVFEITPAGKLTRLYSFCSQAGCADGASPGGALLQATNGDFYGTTTTGGAYDAGTVFEITPAGTLTTLYSFCQQPGCADGQDTTAGLVQATNGSFYGTTLAGGAYDGGTAFEITPAGTLTTLYSFCSQRSLSCADGRLPFAGLVQATNGNFYGTTLEGGAYDGGTAFEITPAGKLVTLATFDGTDGYFPSSLVQATNGNFYGTTINGGAYGGGTVFEITPAGNLTTLASFDGYYYPGDLVQATDGNFYGTAGASGSGGDCPVDSGCGAVFEITPAGTLTTLYSFCSQKRCADGTFAGAGLVQATDGNLYGTTALGGAPSDDCKHGCGTVFGLSVGLGPFVKTNPTSGTAGTKVIILGNDLTGTTSVTFDGMAARFAVNSTGTAIATSVPIGATTGNVEVTTPSGTLTSNVPFNVTQ
jgi:uncharacterized repeat protein (TIGR03803 family)